jgi:hypothetical protein
MQQIDISAGDEGGGCIQKTLRMRRQSATLNGETAWIAPPGLAGIL